MSKQNDVSTFATCPNVTQFFFPHPQLSQVVVQRELHYKCKSHDNWPPRNPKKNPISATFSTFQLVFSNLRIFNSENSPLRKIGRTPGRGKFAPSPTLPNIFACVVEGNNTHTHTQVRYSVTELGKYLTGTNFPGASFPARSLAQFCRYSLLLDILEWKLIGSCEGTDLPYGSI